MKNVEMRKVYCQTMTEIAHKNENVYLLEADLMSAIASNSFKKEFPHRVINCGIMESEMIGVASGLSLTGKIPYVHSFSAFSTRRVFDQLYLSLAYAGLPAVIIGSDAGICSEHNGGTHTSFEDVGLMRMLPNCKVIDVTDSSMFKWLLQYTADNPDFYYIRTSRKAVESIYPQDENFEIGKAKVLREGNDVTIIASGIMVSNAVKAADILKERGIKASIIDMFTIQPLDNDVVLEFARKTKTVITVENHYTNGGLGTAVSEVLAENPCGVKLRRLGIKQKFGQVGTLSYLQEVFGLTTEDIVNVALEECECVNK